MLGPLIVSYLFLGGAGAGACLVLAVLGLLVPCERIAVAGERAGRGRSICQEASPRTSLRIVVRVPDTYRRLMFPGYAVALAVLALGMTCLLADVGRADRIALLFTSPTPSFITVGAWSLAVCAVLAAVSGLVWGGFMRRLDVVAARLLAVLLILVALTVMVYTGLLLQSIKAVPLWATPLLPAVFVLSSLSCGAALVLATAQFSGAAGMFSAVFRRLVAVDIAVVVLEAAAVAVFVALAFVGIGGDFIAGLTAEALAASVKVLIAGEAAWLFWGGFVLVGIGAPLLFDGMLVRARRMRAPLVLAAAACVLTGGAVLRFCVVEAGIHPMLAIAAMG